MNVASMMSSPVHTVRKDASVAEVVRTMKDRRVSVVPVVDEGDKVVGVITVSDLVPQVRNAPASNIQLLSLRNEYIDFASIGSAYEKVSRLPASEVMKEPVATIRPETEIGTAAKLMAEHEIGSLPVVSDDGVLVGIVTRTDLARLAIDQGRA